MNQPRHASLRAESRLRLASWVETPRVQYSIVVLIVINAITLGLETSPTVMAHAGSWLLALDNFVLGVFVVEISVKLYAHRWRFFHDPWNVFDFIIIAIALIPDSGPLAVLRALRILRVLRLISMVPRLRFVVESLLHAIPGIAAIAALLVLLYYVFAVMATGLFGAALRTFLKCSKAVAVSGVSVVIRIASQLVPSPASCNNWSLSSARIASMSSPL